MKPKTKPVVSLKNLTKRLKDKHARETAASNVMMDRFDSGDFSEVDRSDESFEHNKDGCVWVTVRICVEKTASMDDDGEPTWWQPIFVPVR